MSQEMEKINKADEALQDRVRRDPTSCDHLGFFTPLGYDTYQLPNENILIASSVLCMMCGHQWNNIQEVNWQRPLPPGQKVE